MARRSGRLSGVNEANAMRKRNLSGSTSEVNKRPKHDNTTPTKSRYFKPAKTSKYVEADSEEEDEIASGTSEEVSGSDFGKDGTDTEESDAEEPEVDEDDEDDHAAPKRKTPATGRSPAGAKGEHVWKPGVKAGLGPGTQVIIKKPKARPAGKIPYTDTTIHPNTLLFLQDLKVNNKREWLKLNDPDFRQAEKDWHTFVEGMTEKLIEIDDTIPELPVKDVIFRIYRDVRFSKDPTPYKAWFSVAWSRAGRKGPFSHYYVQITPGNSFVGGGLWHPEAAPTAAMRRVIDRHPRRLKDVLLNDKIRKEYLSGAAKNDKAVVKAFVKSNSENALKTKPKGFDADHPELDLLRLRNHTIGRKLSDEEVLGERGTKRVAELLAALRPFITFLNSVVMPDDPSGSADEEEDEDDADDDDDNND